MCHGDPENNEPEFEYIYGKIFQDICGWALLSLLKQQFSHFYVQSHATKRAWDVAPFLGGGTVSDTRERLSDTRLDILLDQVQTRATMRIIMGLYLLLLKYGTKSPQ